MHGAKEYLQSVQRMERIIDQKRREIAALTSLGATDYSGAKVQSGPSRTTENRALRYGKLIAELEKEVDRYVERRREIVLQIQSMDNTAYMELLYKRYVEGKKLELIAVEMNYSYARTRHLHGYALIAFGQQIDTQKHDRTC